MNTRINNIYVGIYLPAVVNNLMRAPPPPRRSRSRFLALCVVRLRQLISGHRLKKRWHLHKLHEFQRKGLICLSPESGIRAEDMINIPSALQPKKTRQKPLLIAAFPKGCSRSPRVRVLQRNRLSRLMISKRKYKLKPFEVKGRHDREEDGAVTHRCAQTVGSIKKLTASNADVRVIFHDTNVIKCSNLIVPAEADQCSPELFEFAPNQSIRIHDYPSLRRKPTPGHDQNLEIVAKSISDLTTSEETRSHGGREPSSFELQSSTCQDNEQLYSNIVKMTEFADSPIISYSKLVRSPLKERKNRQRFGFHSSRQKRALQALHRS
ncbi:hypothetical protein HG536_0A08010 [Torulaspora globosa]|uniref:Uncharacterized protein n=1 Tax=Torulaspora globosa TaxID=48254 RepID=A0A7G3ZBV0_9SACH|nr:uncharacterized protein HG536_0A08010 [Torulaspora globosa]QLL30986.1 hypothetical protein HG536_0A08010 [Torulaspora globosa]